VFPIICEAQFLSANAASPVRTEQVESKAIDVCRVADGNEAVDILKRPNTAVPVSQGMMWPTS